MPVTVKPTSNQANLAEIRPQSTAEELLAAACPKEHRAEFKELIQSSFTNLDLEMPTVAKSNGFVHAAISAYSQHYHLVIRPDDVWFAILTQLSLYINQHAEELRGKFVAHEGTRELEIIRGGDRFTTDLGEMAEAMGHQLQKHIVDEELRDWIMPTFTTTTKQDEVVASVIMMGAMQKYFSYKFTLCCGLPSVTLLGEQSDWENMVARLEKLKTFGEETEVWYTLLRPVLSRFVTSFKHPEAAKVKDFWNKIAGHTSQMSGPSYYSGWITAFCFWNDSGRLMYDLPLSTKPRAGNEKPRKGQLNLDGAVYHRIETTSVPSGYTTVPVKINDNGFKFMSRMIAGSVGMKYTRSGKQGAGGTEGLDTLQPATGWFLYMTKEEIVEEE